MFGDVSDVCGVSEESGKATVGKQAACQLSWLCRPVLTAFQLS